MRSKHRGGVHLSPARRNPCLLVAILAVAAGGVWALWPLLRGTGAHARPEGTVRLRYRLNLQGEGPAADRDTRPVPGLVQRAWEAVEPRLRAEGIVGVEMSPAEGAAFDLYLPPGADLARARRVVAGLPITSTADRCAFRIEVRPEYPPFPPSRFHGTRTREQVWLGALGSGPEGASFDATPAGFEAFKAREIARWLAARDRGVPYEPLDARYQLVPRARGDGEAPASGPDDFAVLEVPTSAEERFDGETIEDAKPRSGAAGPFVLLWVRARDRARFHAWTGRNVGLPLAIVIGGVLHGAPVLSSALSDSVLITPAHSVPSRVNAIEAAEAEQREKQAQEQLVSMLRWGAPGTLPAALREDPSGPDAR